MKKFIYTFLALVLAFSLAGFAAPAPAQAQEEETLEVLPYTLEATDTPTTATAKWVTAQKYNGSYSVELDLDNGNTEYAEVAFPLPGNITLADIELDTTSFWCYSTAGAHIPYFTFELTPFGVWNNSFRINNDAASSTGYTDDFAQFVASSATSEWQLAGDTGDGSWVEWDDLVAEYGTAVVTGVYVGISGLDATVYTAYVDDITVNGTTYYGLIQDAVDSATGTIINVAAGTYNEDVTVDLNLTFTGAQAGVDARGRTGVPESEIVGSIHVTSDASDVTIDGFKVTATTDPPIRGSCMLIESADSTINNNIVVSVEPPTSPTSFLWFDGVTDTVVEQNAFSGYYRDDWRPNVILVYIVSGGSTVTVQNNEMHDVGGGGGIGIMCDNEDAIINIAGNEIDNTGDGIWVANWLEPSQATVLDTLTITGNEIYDCHWNNLGSRNGSYIGIKIIDVIEASTGTVIIEANNIHDNEDTGIYLNSPQMDVYIQNGNTITNIGSPGGSGIEIGQALGTYLIDGNDISENDADGIYIGSTTGGSQGDVTISHNRIFGNDGSGISLDEDACGVEVLDNCIIRNYHGVYIAGDDNVIGKEGHGNVISSNTGYDSGVHLTRDAFGNVINYNDITFNSSVTYGVYNENFVPVDATNNWWGDASGPGGEGPGTGDTVGDYVLYDPWLGAPAVDTADPQITYSGVSPSMVSLWSDNMFRDMWGCDTNYSVGPSCFTKFSVKASDVGCGVAMVTINKKDLLLSMIPEAKLQKFLDDPEGWEEFLARLEAELGSIPMYYDEGYGCWVHGECLCALLYIVMDILHVDPIEVAEIMGQELNLGEFEVEVTAYDYSGNTDTALITITIVDFQMPVCEGWNLRSTWLGLENNKWENIVATDDGLDADSILRWNSELQRWEQYQEVADVGYWYYGVTQVAPALMQTLESYWIHGVYNDQFGLITYRGVSAPPSRQLYAGWNLIGAALAWQQPGLRVNDALLSVYEGEAHCTGYTQVLSIDQSNWWPEWYYICDTYEYGYPGGEPFTCWCGPPYPRKFMGAYHKCFWQDTWVYTRRGNPDGPPPPPVTRGGGYWVFMQNPAVLAGFNSTPLPVEFWRSWWECGD